jgi:hypothetical protein
MSTCFQPKTPRLVLKHLRKRLDRLAQEDLLMLLSQEPDRSWPAAPLDVPSPRGAD